MTDLEFIQDSIKRHSIELIDIANNEHDIDEFNLMFEHIQAMKQLADEIEYEQCG